MLINIEYKMSNIECFYNLSIHSIFDILKFNIFLSAALHPVLLITGSAISFTATCF